MPITLSLPLINRVLACALVLLTLAGLGVEVAHYRFGVESDLQGIFGLSYETNVPSWYSSMLLFSCALLLGLIACAKRQAGGAYRGHWAVLALIFLYISMDEASQIHEHLNTLVVTHGILYYAWVVPFGLMVLLFAAAYLKFLFHLPFRTRFRFALAGILYVGGALGVELALGAWADVHGDENLVYAVIDLVEESLEILGTSIFCSALLEYLGSLGQEVRLAIRTSPAP